MKVAINCAWEQKSRPVMFWFPRLFKIIKSQSLETSNAENNIVVMTGHAGRWVGASARQITECSKVCALDLGNPSSKPAVLFASSATLQITSLSYSCKCREDESTYLTNCCSKADGKSLTVLPREHGDRQQNLLEDSTLEESTSKHSDKKGPQRHESSETASSLTQLELDVCCAHICWETSCMGLKDQSL